MRPRSFAPRALALVMLAAVWTISDPAAASNPTLHFSKAYVNSPGTDTGSNTSLNAEYVVVSNSSYTTAYRLTGYTIRDRSSHIYKFPTFTLRPRASVAVHTGRGTNTSANLYWGASYYIWNNAGYTAYLRSAGGVFKDSCSWRAVSSYLYC